MVLKDLQTGELRKAVVERVEDEDFKWIKKRDSPFKNFKWDKYRLKEVYKLRLRDQTSILGLMCIIDHTDPHTNAIEIKLLEIGQYNVGKAKGLDYIAGCLIAFACRESFIRGHDGYVFLTPKTNLIRHYTQYYGMKYTPPFGANQEGVMISDPGTSQKLIKQFIE